MAGESVSHDQLRAFVDRIERMDEELKAINDDKREIYAEAKGNGFDVAALKAVIKIRRQDHVERMELEAIIEIYMSALGMQVAPRDDDEPRARAGARTREDRSTDAETGEIIETTELVQKMHEFTEPASPFGAAEESERGTVAVGSIAIQRPPGCQHPDACHSSQRRTLCWSCSHAMAQAEEGLSV